MKILHFLYFIRITKKSDKRNNINTARPNSYEKISDEFVKR